MLGLERRQFGFMDAEVLARFVPQDHPLAVIRREIDFSFVTEETRALYHPDTGRPSYPPSVLFRMLFLEIWAGLSDVQVCRELGYNLLYRYFCGLGCDDQVPDDTTLVVFRRRLGDQTFARLLGRVVEQAKDRGQLRGKWALLDGTKVAAHAAVRNRLELVRESRRRLHRVLVRRDPSAAQELEPLVRAESDHDYATHGELLEAEKGKSGRLLAELAARQEEEVAAAMEVCRQAMAGEIASLSDPDATWGFKRRDEPFLGYKAHLACDENGMVTAAELTPAHQAEQGQAPRLVDAAKRANPRVRFVAADKAYDAAALRKKVAQKGLRPYIPSKRPADRLLRQGFRYDGRRRRLICPAGKTSLGRHPHQNGGFSFHFSQTDCQRCQRRDTCLPGGQKRKVAYFKPEVLQHRPRGLKRAMSIRKTIERVFAEAKMWHGMGRARYRGRWRVAVQVLLTCIVCNIKKMAKCAPKGRRRLAYRLQPA